MIGVEVFSMQLTNYTEYALRVLIYLGTLNSDERTSIKEISHIFSISENHLSKIVYELGKLGYIKTIRGRNGGFQLAKSPDEIVIGKVVRHLEGDLSIVECFAGRENQCVISPVCRLKPILHEALQAFIKVLDSYTLSDLIKNKIELKQIFQEDSSS